VQNTWLSWGSTVLALILAGSTVAWAAGEPGETGDGLLERQVRILSAALAAARSEADALKARLDGRVLEAMPAAALPESGVRVLEANRDLGLVVMDAGARQGVRAGMVLMAVRGSKSLARVRVVDVRRRVAGAVIEEVLPGSPYPGPGDRLVVVTDGE
jgi:hypothetical protein